eukprot:766762-Hanusia_phi.AAC.10
MPHTPWRLFMQTPTSHDRHWSPVAQLRRARDCDSRAESHCQTNVGTRNIGSHSLQSRVCVRPAAGAVTSLARPPGAGAGSTSARRVPSDRTVRSSDRIGPAQRHGPRPVAAPTPPGPDSS